MKESPINGRGRMAVFMLAGGLLLAESLFSVAYGAGENMRFHGALVAEPCSIPVGEETITLDFGTVIDKVLYRDGRTRSHDFAVTLADCDPDLAAQVKVTFSGTESAALSGLLAPEGASNAKGIAIGLETLQAEPLPLDTASRAFRLTDGSNRIALKAYVQGEPAAIASRSITPGTFEAMATFSLEYE